MTPKNYEGKNWRERLKINGWTSSYASVNKLLRHLAKENSGSLASQISYCHIVDFFCRENGTNPDQLVKMPREKLEEVIRNFLDKHSKSHGTANSYKEYFKTFFRENGKKNLEFPHYYQPSRGGRAKPEYIPTLEEAWKMADHAGSLKARVVVLILTFLGLRNSTLRALKYGIGSPDPMLQHYTIKEELERGKQNIAIIVYSEMKRYVPNACKGKIPYYVFTPMPVTETLRNYLNERKRFQGGIRSEEFLIPSDSKGLPKDVRLFTPISDREIRFIVRNAARRAGIEHWQHVAPHSLRKVFDHVLRNQPQESRLDTKDQEFFMGHIIPGSAEAYYDRTKVEEMREKFSKLIFESHAYIAGERFLRELAKFHGLDYNAAVIEARRKKGGEPIQDDIMDVLKEWVEQKGRKTQKIITRSELQAYLDNGWEVRHVLSEDEVVVCKAADGWRGTDGKKPEEKSTQPKESKSLTFQGKSEASETTLQKGGCSREGQRHLDDGAWNKSENRRKERLHGQMDILDFV